jgi:hypothetical protein
MKVEYKLKFLPFCCGVSVVGDFCKNSPDFVYNSKDVEDVDDLAAEIEKQTGLLVATFRVKDNDSKKGFKMMCKVATLLYRSANYMNHDTNNMVYLCVFKKGQ